MKVFFTIDTEEDNWGDYRTVGNTTENVAQIPLIQDIFDHYGAMPNYMINWPVVMDNRSRDVLLKILAKGKCEIGNHCHPWNTPPFEENIEARNTMMSNLPYGLIKKKITNLHQAIIDRMGVAPRCFRTGRWAFSSNVARVIHDLGYKVDSSVTPFIDWSSYHGPDFRRAQSTIYRFNPNNILRPEADGTMLEVQASIGFYQKNFRRNQLIRNSIANGPLAKFRIIGILDRLKLLNLRWLSPELTNGLDMIRLSKAFMKTGHQFLNMSFHSTSLLPGKSPFVRDHNQLKSFLERIEMFLNFATKQGFTFAPLSSVLQTPNNSLPKR